MYTNTLYVYTIYALCAKNGIKKPGKRFLCCFHQQIRILYSLFVAISGV